ncbi:MAG TPA: 3-deoxy-7-phosphoheptulonate synthase [Bdellovibrionota bacterium]|nr:3-deoxy-7-phosphoheptulonate synthase [Bdellovibrionota bacterium]
MLIIMKAGHQKKDIDTVVARIQALGFKSHIIPGEHSVAIGITGNTGPVDPEPFSMLEGVEDAIPVTKPYKLAGRDFKPGKTEVKVGKVTFGPGRFVVIGGPCAVETEEQTLRIADAVAQGGAKILRGGAFKPRSSPYSFQGLGLQGLKILDKARKNTGLPIVTEAVDTESLKMVNDWADIIQIGARNMQNFTLLSEVGKLRKPVLLKRGMSATIDEWLMAAEYILGEGNDQVILAERGVRSFDTHTRNMLDLSAVPVIHSLSHLPILVDPSHGTGKRHMVVPMARSALAAGAQAVMVDVHDQPETALCDGPQALHPRDFAEMVKSFHALAPALGVKME